ncbi:hypothetical protein EJ05DRAFT_232294 [Pseudovirgaria hyperparasitica]|uniref:Protein kinase domain-containing protein n=1 Tax=Pseudovirgaria hyperparasitica TaxID=470096 RepID=A0A6A6VRZ8_9PEZI|nr:uncharacterized protein EJ05DRAFT_232294 [Pseudovirgaria hyperparasitica]KAF2752973.1 hypothetical protein EJ05DRAFT_232294 [Pseudovirgaria hyperparasitica]
MTPRRIPLSMLDSDEEMKPPSEMSLSSTPELSTTLPITPPKEREASQQEPESAADLTLTLPNTDAKLKLKRKKKLAHGKNCAQVWKVVVMKDAANPDGVLGFRPGQVLVVKIFSTKYYATPFTDNESGSITRSDVVEALKAANSQEVTALQRCNEESVTPIFYANFDDDAHPYPYPREEFHKVVVMEYIKGCHLDKLQASPETKRKVMIKIIDGVSNLWKNGICIRNIPPRNIILRETSSSELIPVITDFAETELFDDSETRPHPITYWMHQREYAELGYIEKPIEKAYAWLCGEYGSQGTIQGCKARQLEGYEKDDPVPPRPSFFHANFWIKEMHEGHDSVYCHWMRKLDDEQRKEAETQRDETLQTGNMVRV